MKSFSKIAGLVFLLASGAGRAGTIAEKFDAAPGPELPAGWTAESLDWSVRDGALRFRGGMDRGFVLPAGATPGGEVAAEATLRIERRTAAGWSLGGLSVRQDDANYWHLALVEAPPDQGGRHFVELSENLAGHWLAQHAETTRLTATEGTGFAWEFGRPYRLRLALRDGGIEGTVCEADGTERARLGYRFDRPAVDWGAPALAGAGVEASFDDFQATVAKPHAPPPAPEIPPFDAPAVCPEIRGAATGFYHAQAIDGRDWLIDPKGRGFYLIGTDHVRYEGHGCEKLGYAPYGRVAQKKYGGEAAWAEATLARLKAWGFNTLTAGHSPSLRHHGLAHVEFIAFGSNYAGRDDLCPRTTWTGFPDVFGPDWPRYCDLLARRVCAPQRDDPWLAGYFFDNELEWYGKSGRESGLFEEAWKKPADHPAKRAWRSFLEESCGTIAVFNERFGTACADFGALAADTQPRPPRGPEGEKTAREWVRRVAEFYFRTCAEAVRRHDPNHLLLGCRFAGRAPEIWDIAGKYCDVVSLNIYPRIDVDRGVPADVLEFVSGNQRQTGKPMMITEWSFPALDAGLPSRHGAGMRVDTQAQRARCFAFFQDFLFRHPHVVGSDYFMYLDEPALGISASFPEDSNYGLVNGEDEPYPAIVAAATAVNADAGRRHREGGFQPAAVAKPAAAPAWLREVAAAADVPATLRRTIGRLTLEGPSGGMAWKMSLDGRAVADLFPMVHQQTAGGSQWVRPQTARIVARRENARAEAVDLEFEYRAAPGGAGGPRSYRAAVRYWIPKSGGGWVASQALEVENTDAQPWRLGGFFHYLSPKADGDPAKIEPLSDAPDYYRQVCAWVDRGHGSLAGCWFPEGSAFKCNYWKDAPAAFHSDLRVETDLELAPGAKWAGAPDLAFFYALPEATLEAHAAACRRIAQECGFEAAGTAQAEH